MYQIRKVLTNVTFVECSCEYLLHEELLYAFYHSLKGF